MAGVLIQRLANCLAMAPPDCGWYPQAIAEAWPDEAQDVAYDFAPADRQVELMLLAVHPSENLEGTSFPRPYIYTVRPPKFEFNLARPGEIVSIGSGSTFEPYRQALSDIKANQFYERLATIPNGIQFSIAAKIASEIEANPSGDVSRFVHMCTVARGGAWIAPFRRRDLTFNGKNDLIMPPVASTYEQFIRGDINRDRSTAIASHQHV